MVPAWHENKQRTSCWVELTPFPPRRAVARRRAIPAIGRDPVRCGVVLGLRRRRRASANQPHQAQLKPVLRLRTPLTIG